MSCGGLFHSTGPTYGAVLYKIKVHARMKMYCSSVLSKEFNVFLVFFGESLTKYTVVDSEYLSYFHDWQSGISN